MRISIEVSPGELFDRITILELKRTRLPVSLRAGAAAELGRLCSAQERLMGTSEPVRKLVERLRAINDVLWMLEDALRRCERERAFGAEFVELARAVCRNNDERAALKRAIDSEHGCVSPDQKSYELPEVLTA
jgi:hypothetical protein